MLGSLARWIGFLTMTVCVAGAVVLAGGFLWFVSNIASEEVTLDRNADGIVVLTGAAARIPDAIELLAAEHGKRLLITGVHRTISAKEIARLTPLYTKYFTCCIDLDRSALNTFGNALETKRWAHDHNFMTLIVVTSNWHMPRALVELEHQLPEVKLIAFPVMSVKLKTEPWWQSVDTARLLFGEYLKYLLALTRMRLDSEGVA
ncbi:YdcF family protein [Pseudolabrys taiwanensis]|uniref:YdcF family protein n=1 Tax=Pseudolabrys taiwanensis TaxID=331696 RepID=A0A346A1I7_9HYPH|nr:YdcF family protein [Pseudolabrys taiwanensis]AXK83034.1 YdcF family protein [Pseudolabrys taiwanensis]